MFIPCLCCMSICKHAFTWHKDKVTSGRHLKSLRFSLRTKVRGCSWWFPTCTRSPVSYCHAPLRRQPSQTWRDMEQDTLITFYLFLLGKRCSSFACTDFWTKGDACGGSGTGWASFVYLWRSSRCHGMPFNWLVPLSLQFAALCVIEPSFCQPCFNCLYSLLLVHSRYKHIWM